MKFEIKHRWNGTLLFECEAANFRIAVELAISKGADLRSADLRSADLSYADLRSADLRSADLRSANLRSADLSYADLSYADLRSADLSYADLSYADLSYADLRSADLSYADLRSANLRYADLSSADLRYADISYADLRSANLRYADLRSADLRYANLRSAANITAIDFEHLFQIPQEGELVVWGKKNGKLVKMRVPPEAKRTGNIKNRKCRAEFVEVLWVEGDAPATVVNEWAETKYVVGEIVRPHEWCDNGLEDCRPGIHFFLTKKEAEMWD